MNLDEQILKRVDKQMLNQLVNENVIPSKEIELKKVAKLWPFFLKSINKLENLKYIHP